MRLSVWLALVRVLQILCALTCAGANGFLVAYDVIRKLGLSRNMSAVELMICILLVYVTVAVLVQHTGRRSKSTGWLVAFLIFDVIFFGLDVAIITVLAATGLPAQCADVFNNTELTAFANEDDDSGSSNPSVPHAAPPEYCALERTFYFTCIGMLFTFILTIVLMVLRITQAKYISRKEHAQILASMEAQYELDHKIHMERHNSQSARALSPTPQSEGIASHRPSLLSSSGSAPPQLPSGPTIGAIPRPGSLRYPRAASSVATSSGMFVPLALDLSDNHSIVSSDAGAHVADGLQHSGHARTLLAPSIMEEQTAEDALVSDGMQAGPSRRPQSPLLPPYQLAAGSGSSLRMAGHADESNEIRLSEYVKGGTRAQDLKDSGRW